jgi:hypothetical protein
LQFALQFHSTLLGKRSSPWTSRKDRTNRATEKTGFSGALAAMK